MKQLIKILIPFLVAFFLNGITLGEEVFLSATDSIYKKEVANNPDQESDQFYLFAIHQQAEGGINTLRSLIDSNLSVSQEDLFQSVLVEANIQRHIAAFLQSCRIINQYSELTKLIYPFHFFF